MTKLPRKKRQPRRETCTDRILVTTSRLAKDVAEQWGTTKVELYRFLVELAEEYPTATALAAALQPKRLAEVAGEVQEEE